MTASNIIVISLVNHCHVFPKGLFSNLSGGNEEDKGTLAHLKSYMKETGISKAVIFPPFPHFCKKIDTNAWLAEQIKNEPQFIGFANIDPKQVDSVQKLKKTFESGLRGVKIHPPILKTRIDDRRNFCFYEKAEELGMPILFHTGVHGWELESYRPLLIDKIAQTFPELNIIIEHLGGEAFFNEALAVLQNNSNTYAGITTTLLPILESEWNPWYQGTERIKMVLRQIGENRVIYGTDFPYNDAAITHREIEIIKNLELNNEIKNKILGGNLKKLLRLPLVKELRSYEAKEDSKIGIILREDSCL